MEKQKKSNGFMLAATLGAAVVISVGICGSLLLVGEVGGHATSSKTAEQVAIQQDVHDEMQAEMVLGRRLKDAGSAHIYGETIYRVKDVNAVTVCGEVNAKNSFGGYVGAERFIVVAGVVALTPSLIGDRAFAHSYDVYCQNWDTAADQDAAVNRMERLDH